MLEYLGTDGDTPTATNILQGTPPGNLTTVMNTLLKEMKQKRSELSPYMLYQKMIEGFKKWRESTTTSPSGKHLGIYKTLVKFQQSTYQPQPKTKSKKE
jgi:hypothetical protein